MDNQTSDNASAPTAASYPSWVLLDYLGACDDRPADARTVAHARTSGGRPISVSFLLAAPPAMSRVRVDGPGMSDRRNTSVIVAAHGDSVLIEVATKIDGRGSTDYFLYCAGDAGADPSRPPSLSLLPPGHITETSYLDASAAALLRRGQDEVLVAALDSYTSINQIGNSGPAEAELFVLRSDHWQWELKRLPVVVQDEGKRPEFSCWVTDRVIPVGDRFLLWVDCYLGILYSDLWQDAPEMRYVALPLQPEEYTSPDDRVWSSYRSVCATQYGAVRFVGVFPRCCCGRPGATDCAVSRHAFTITTWALRMDDMATWDKVGVVDCDELCSLAGYHGVVPRIMPDYPTVSFDDPDVLCFMVRKNKHRSDDIDGEDLALRLIELDLDTGRMELRSICHYDREPFLFIRFVVSAVSSYFSGDHSRAIRKEDAYLEAPARPLKLSLPRVASPEEMLATLREIPDLARDDLLKVYGVLEWDESRSKFRSLVALPMDMRRDYCLVIGKLSCFDV